MKSSKDIRDLIIIFVIITIVLILSSIFHWIDDLKRIAMTTDKLDIIELLTVLSFLSILASIFAFRRWDEIKKEITVKEQLLQDIRDSEKRLLSTVDLSPDTIIIHRESIIVFTNRAGVYMFGAESIDDVLGKNILDFIHPSQKASVIDRIKRMNKGFQKLPNVELLVKRFDNKYIDVEMASTPVTYHDFPHIITIIRDITDRKENEEKLKESEERLQSILDNSSAVIFLKDINGCYILVNKQFEKIFNLNRDKIRWKTDFDIFPKEIAEQFVENDNYVLNNKIEKTVEELAPQKDGIHTYLSVKFPLFNAFGTPYAVCGIATDITERKKLEETKSRLATIVASSEDAIVSYSLEGKVLTWNPGAEKIYGYSPDEMMGSSIKKLIPEDHLNELENLLIKINKGQKVDHYETKRKTKDNRVIDVSLTISPIKDDRNNIAAASAISRDITYKKAVENEMRKYAEELALYNEELYVFSYAASHDLQEPLRNIRKFIVTLKDEYYEKFDDNFRSQIDFAEDGSIRMYRLISDFLSYSRINSDKTKYESSDFNSIISDSISNLKTAIEETAAKFFIADMPVVFCNKLQLTQVFQNLISNSLKYKGNNSPEIKIGVEDKDGQYLIWLSDNGIGIEQWFHERIFIIFQKLHDHKKYPGSGIGLALCKRIIEKHGGKIWFESEAGIGTTFYFTIPKN